MNYSKKTKRPTYKATFVKRNKQKFTKYFYTKASRKRALAGYRAAGGICMAR